MLLLTGASMAPALPETPGPGYAPSMDHTKGSFHSPGFRFAPLQRAQYLLSVTQKGQLPPDDGAEVAMAGRSNVGKSSVLNRLCSQRALARVSRTPGRTQALNFFGLDEGQRLVDLPGYGYAKVPEALRLHWGQLLEHYVRQRQSLAGIVLVMDIRHPLMPFDQDLLTFAKHCQRPVHILLNKSDKLSRGAARSTWEALQRRPELQDASLQLFSAHTGQGLDELQWHLAQWLEKKSPTTGRGQA